MITWLIFTIFSCIVSIFIIHFVGLGISSAIRKKNKGWGIKLGKHVEVSITSEPSLIVHYYHYYKWYIEEESYDNKMFAKNLNIIIGGFSINIRYGHEGVADSDESYGDFCNSKSWGLYSIDGEKFWRDFWWGKKIYDNPFAPTKFLGGWILDVANGELINRKFLDKFEKEYNPNFKFPYVYEKENDIYVNKNCEKQIVPFIHFWYEMRAWTLPILYWLKLSWLYQMKRVDLDFNIESIGTPFNGIGANADSDWKGGVYGTGIKIDSSEMLNMFNSIANGNMYSVSRFNSCTNGIIYDFMRLQHKY